MYAAVHRASAALANIPPKINRKWKCCFSPFLYRNRNANDRRAIAEDSKFACADLNCSVAQQFCRHIALIRSMAVRSESIVAEQYQSIENMA